MYTGKMKRESYYLFVVDEQPLEMCGKGQRRLRGLRGLPKRAARNLAGAGNSAAARREKRHDIK